MTLKDKRDHYNVKLLKGYGHSISVKNSKLILKDNHDPFSEPEIEEWFPNKILFFAILTGNLIIDQTSLLSPALKQVCLFFNPSKIAMRAIR